MSDDAEPIGWRFGNYALYPAQRRLLRAGVPVEVEDRAFDLLVCLVRNHERELARGEIVATLWPARPVSDATLRQTLHRARVAVGDDGKRQVAIRTLHGRSLRWVMPVEPIVSSAAAESPTPAAVPKGERRREPRRRRAWLGLVALLLVTIAALSVRNAVAPPHAKPPRLAIEPVVNTTGDAALDWTRDGLPGLVAGLLAQAGGVDVVDPVRSARLWTYPPQAGRSQAEQFRFATAADWLVSARLRKLTAQLFELDVRLVDANGATRTFSVTAARPSDLAVDAVARIRHQLRLDPRADPGALPAKAFLAEAYARGMDLAAHGDWKAARDDFQLTANGAPDFAGAQLNLAIAEAFTGDLAAGKRRFAALSAASRRRHDTRTQLLASLWQARLQRDYSAPETALAGLRAVATLAQATGNTEVEIEARAMLADTLYKLRRGASSRHELEHAERLAAAHPGLHDARAIVYDIESELANGDGDYASALAAAHKVLALKQSLGDLNGVLVSKFYVAQALYSLGRPLQALAVSARAYRDARRAGRLELQYDHGALVVAVMIELGMSRPAGTAATVLERMASELGSNTERFSALQLRAIAAMQRSDFAAARADLVKAAALVDLGKIDHADYFNQVLYLALATYVAKPAALADELDAFEARAGEFGNDRVFAGRAAQLRALVAAAARQPEQARARLQEAANLPAPAEDRDLERRLAPMLIAVVGHDPAAAAIALNGYDAESTSDAGILPQYARWQRQQGNAAAAAKAESRLAVLRAEGRAALVAAGIDPVTPFAVPTAPRGNAAGR